MKALHVLIDTLEAMAASNLPLMAGELPDVHRVADRLVSLALTYDQDALAQAGIRLCSLIAVFRRDNALLCRVRGACQACEACQARRAVVLHVRVLRLLAPGNCLTPSAAGLMLVGLDRLVCHFGGIPTAVGAGCPASDR